ncbi:MAG: haloacid dehalogenase [Candidatus Helarchaeota archaeon]
MFKKIFDQIKEKLDIEDNIRETTLKLSRQSIRFTQEAIKAIHRREFNNAKEKLGEARELIQEVETNIKEISPRLYYKGYVTDMQQEFVEASVFMRLLEGDDEIPGPNELKVSNYAYLQGLGEVIGELRRHALDSIRYDDVQEAERCLKYMEDIFSLLLTLDYPEGLIPGIRRKTDIARSLIEKTRDDIAYFSHGNKLIGYMDRVLKKLKRLDENKGS